MSAKVTRTSTIMTVNMAGNGKLAIFCAKSFKMMRIDSMRVNNATNGLRQKV